MFQSCNAGTNIAQTGHPEALCSAGTNVGRLGLDCLIQIIPIWSEPCHTSRAKSGHRTIQPCLLIPAKPSRAIVLYSCAWLVTPEPSRAIVLYGHAWLVPAEPSRAIVLYGHAWLVPAEPSRAIVLWQCLAGPSQAEQGHHSIRQCLADPSQSKPIG
jgi:hypothetical protein